MQLMDAEEAAAEEEAEARQRRAEAEEEIRMAALQVGHKRTHLHEQSHT